MTRVHCTSPTGERKPPVRPFAALPHDLAGDPTLSPTAKAVLLALLFWARAHDRCWPSDRSIGGRIGRAIPTVQRQLRALERRGLLRREKAANPTGRLIVLTWRAAPPPIPRDHGGRSPVIAPPRSPVIDEGTVHVGDALKKIEPEIPGNVHGAPAKPVVRPAPSAPIRPSPALPMAPRTPEGPARRGPSPADLAAWLTSDDPILAAEAARKLAPPVRVPEAISRPATVAEFLARIREDPGRPIEAAELLAQEFDDRKSWHGFHARCQEAWRGVLEPADLVAAYEAATSAGTRKRGAVFMTVLGRVGPGSSRPRPR